MIPEFKRAVLLEDFPDYGFRASEVTAGQRKMIDRA
jgi:hypothetical protein